MHIVSNDMGEVKGGNEFRLLPNHIADLCASGLSDSQIEACGFFSEANPDRLRKLLGWKSATTILGACLCFPFRDRDRNDTGYVIVKPDTPREKKGKKVKYESPLGVPLRAYIPPNTHFVLGDPAIPLLITEGVKKAAKADQEGFACIGLAGVYGWCKKRVTEQNEKRIGPRELIPDLAAIAWRGRPVTIVFDSDVATNPNVKSAERHLAEVLTTAGAIVKAVRLPTRVDGSKIGLDDYLVAHTPNDLRHLIDAAKLAATAPEETKEHGGRPNAADMLAEIGLEYELWHDAMQTAYATAGRHSYAVKSKSFRQLLAREYRKQTGKVPGGESLTNAIATLEAVAVHDWPEYPIHVRVAEYDGRVYLHLADKESTVIEIDASGWRECPKPPVRFRKPSGMLPLPMPQRGGHLNDLRAFLNVPDANGFSLIVAWLMGCLRPDGPFPILVLLGEQGSAKSTTGRVLKRLIDPTAAPLRSEPKEVRDLMIQARNGLLLSFDNLSGLPVWLSDALCQLATGGGFTTRELYTNDEEVILDVKRPLVVNGIEDFITRADLLERSLLIYHPPIPEEKRRAESEFWAEFDAAHPKLLGAVLDRVSAGLRALPSTKVSRLPRMADFSLFAVACELGSGEKEQFLSAYADNQAGAHEQALDASPIPGALLRFMERRNRWEGSPAELYAELTRLAQNPESRDWPKRPNVLTNKLRRLAPNLRRVHRLDVEYGRVSGGKSVAVHPDHTVARKRVGDIVPTVPRRTRSIELQRGIIAFAWGRCRRTVSYTGDRNRPL